MLYCIRSERLNTHHSRKNTGDSGQSEIDYYLLTDQALQKTGLL